MVLCKKIKKLWLYCVRTQSFDYETNLLISLELNKKFGLKSSVIHHKKIYWVIKIPASDNNILRNLINKHLIETMKYKLPKGDSI